jgi:hypothetical protein
MTLKYKASDRYAIGWDDIYDAPIKMNLQRKTGFEDVPTDVLRNLWLVKFGGRVVTIKDMHNHRFDDIADVGQELAKRNQIRRDEHYRADTMETTTYYVLEKDNGNH